jgi:oxygen-independent coproporphyrinogen III oxidase
MDDLVIDPALIRKYDRAGPRYTSYPTADRFVEAFDTEAYAQWLGARRIGGNRQGLSLYVHLPFCDTICYYCACNKVVTKDHDRAERYLGYLGREIAMHAALLGDDRKIAQLHWGGGTPTFLRPDEMRRLMGLLRDQFDFAADGEYAIEIDPRTVTEDTMALLASLGFNRASLGVQDFDPHVQAAVNRVQSEAQTLGVIDAARRAGFRSINIDLIYGLPRQTVMGFNRTLDRIIAANPDRIALYSYAHPPHVFKPQRRIVEAELPTPESKLQILTLAIRRLTDAGYRYIGMDHFARADDELAVAQRQGRLQRNFQGYSTRAESDLLAFGVSAIGAVGPTYYQNHRALPDYYDALDRNELPILRGIELSADDLLRRTVIHALMCHFCLSMESVEIAHLIDFPAYFRTELAELRELQNDGLVEVRDGWIYVTPRGRLLVRNIAMVFDRYLREKAMRAQYSRVI